MKDNQKVYIRGVEGRGDEVIKMLEERGGKQKRLCDGGTHPDRIYFIGYDGMVYSTPIESVTGKILMDCLTELHLPEKWKDGDILVSRSNSQVMALYEFVSDKDADLFNAYFRIDDNMIFSHSLEVRERFRSATDQEVKTFYEILHKHHKDWDAEKKQLVDWRWEPKEGDDYYYIDIDGDIMPDTWEDEDLEVDRYNFGNVFRTREEAEAMAEKVKKLLKGE